MQTDWGQAWVAGGALLVAAAQGQPLRQKPEPICAGQPVGGACWMKLDSRPKCYVWRQSLKRDESVTWTGSCADGRADGLGVLKLSWKGTAFRVVAVEGTGILRNGRMEGRWIERFVRGTVWEGLYLEGKRHGRWVERHPSGTVHEGPYVEGKRHGRWVSCFSGEGAWIEIWGDGTVVDGFRLIPPESICSGQIRGAYATARQERRRSELHLPPPRSAW